MIPRFQRCVHAIARTALTRTAPTHFDEQRAARAAEFLLGVQRQMPDHFRVAFRLLTLLFDAWALPAKGKTFHQLSSQKQLEQLAKWEQSSIGIFRSMVTFYVTFANFSHYSDIYTQD